MLGNLQFIDRLSKVKDLDIGGVIRKKDIVAMDNVERFL